MTLRGGRSFIALRSLCDDKAPGLDGFPIKIFKVFWHVIRYDVMMACAKFHENANLCRSLNTSFISLIPKKNGAVEIFDFRPISLLGGFYKILAKVLAC